MFAKTRARNGIPLVVLNRGHLGAARTAPNEGSRWTAERRIACSISPQTLFIAGEGFRLVDYSGCEMHFLKPAVPLTGVEAGRC